MHLYSRESRDATSLMQLMLAYGADSALDFMLGAVMRLKSTELDALQQLVPGCLAPPLAGGPGVGQEARLRSATRPRQRLPRSCRLVSAAGLPGAGQQAAAFWRPRWRARRWSQPARRSVGWPAISRPAS